MGKKRDGEGREDRKVRRAKSDQQATFKWSSPVTAVRQTLSEDMDRTRVCRGKKRKNTRVRGRTADLCLRRAAL